MAMLYSNVLPNPHHVAPAHFTRGKKPQKKKKIRGKKGQTIFIRKGQTDLRIRVCRPISFVMFYFLERRRKKNQLLVGSFAYFMATAGGEEDEERTQKDWRFLDVDPRIYRSHR